MSAQTHVTVTMVTLKAGNCSSTLCNKVIGSLVRRNCTLLCKLTMCSSFMTVFIGIWLTRILVIWMQSPWQDVSNVEYMLLSWKKSYLLCHFDIPYFMECFIFISKDTKCKLTVQLHILSLKLLDQKKSVPPRPIIMIIKAKYLM